MFAGVVHNVAARLEHGCSVLAGCGDAGNGRTG